MLCIYFLSLYYVVVVADSTLHFARILQNFAFTIFTRHMTCTWQYRSSNIFILHMVLLYKILILVLLHCTLLAPCRILFLLFLQCMLVTLRNHFPAFFSLNVARILQKTFPL